MKQQLNKFLKESKVRNIVVIGDDNYKNLTYLLGEPITFGIYLKAQNKKPALIQSRLDKIKLKIKKRFIEQCKEKAIPSLLKCQNIKGDTAFYYKTELSNSLKLAASLKKAGIRPINSNIIEELRYTKDNSEIKEIKKIAKATHNILKKLLNLIKSCSVSKGFLFNQKEDLTIGHLKSFLKQNLACHNLVEESVISIGKDTSVPHLNSPFTKKISLNNPLLIDLFPYKKGGYNYDMTRCFWIGEADQQIKKVYNDVLFVQKKAIKEIKCNMAAKDLQQKVFDLLKQKNYQTPLDIKNVSRGMLHSLGHGIGLDVHERPFFSKKSKDKLINRTMFAIEPGIYIKNNFGIRIEDVLYIKNSKVYDISTFTKNPVIKFN